MKLAIPLLLCIFLFDFNLSLGQEIIDPVQLSYFVIKRKSPYVTLPSNLGGKSVNGYAAVQISVNDLGKLLYTEVLAIKIKGKINLTYQQHISERTDTVTQFERFLQKHVSEKIEIIKTEIPSPPKVTRIKFLIRFR